MCADLAGFIPSPTTRVPYHFLVLIRWLLAQIRFRFGEIWIEQIFRRPSCTVVDRFVLLDWSSSF